MLNKAWSGAYEVGRWISFDEQIIRCNHRTAKFMQRHMPNKPIKNGEVVCRSMHLCVVSEIVLDQTELWCRSCLETREKREYTAVNSRHEAAP